MINSYKLIGKENAPVILFLHGFMGAGLDWEVVVKSLKNDFRCLLIDLPGHGNSQPDPDGADWRMAETAQSIVDLLDQLGVAPSFMVGYSMGGRLALYLALRYPQYFKAAVVESASPGLKTALERTERIQKDEGLARLLEETEFAEFLTNWYQLPLFQTLARHPQFPELFQRRLNNQPANLAKSLREMGAGRQPSLWEELATNKIPLLLVVGEKDDKFRAIGNEIASKTPSTSTAIVEGCGHNIHFENSEKFVKSVDRFFKDHQFSD